MSDIGHVLPDFVPAAKHADALQALEDNFITTSDLISVNAIDVARRVNIPVDTIEELSSEVVALLHASVKPDHHGKPRSPTSGGTISLMDAGVDEAIGGGIRTGAITEIVGPSGAGKTQFLLSALLGVQLKAPHGLDRSAVYISTEHALPTQRLAGMIEENPILAAADPRPSLARILTLHCPDLETQDHVLQFQLPVILSRHDVGLVVVDSIAANYRAEDVRSSQADVRGGPSIGQLLSNRATELARLGTSLRALARQHACAVLVANQVSDRMDAASLSSAAAVPDPSGARRSPQPLPTASPPDGQLPGSLVASPSPSSSAASSLPSMSQVVNSTPTPVPHFLPADVLGLDHQQRWMSGWGDVRPEVVSPAVAAVLGAGVRRDGQDLKVPTLGLVWTNQLACRIALHKQATTGQVTTALRSEAAVQPPPQTSRLMSEITVTGGADWSKRRWQRRIRLVFAPWAEPCSEDDKGTEYEIWAGGVRSIE